MNGVNATPPHHEADPAPGAHAPDPAAWAAAGAAIAWPPGWRVSAVAATGSTNTDLLEAARRGAPDRSVLATAHQTAGRGRLDRRWDAPPGTNLLVSILLRHPAGPLHESTQRVALAGAEAARRTAGLDVRLKWPNDLLVGDRKVAGVLAQAGSTAGTIDHVVVGIGMNVGWAPEGATCLGATIHPLDVLRELLAAFDALPDDVHPRYRAELGTLGEQVRVELPSGIVEGRAVDVEPDGRLVVLDVCGITHRIDTGDVVHLRRPS